MNELEKQVNHIESELQVHAIQCEERWKTTFNRLEDIDETLERIENRVVISAGGIIMFLAGLLATILLR